MGILCLQLHLQVSQASDGNSRGDGEVGQHWGKSTVPCTGEITRRHLGAPALPARPSASFPVRSGPCGDGLLSLRMASEGPFPALAALSFLGDLPLTF